MGATITYMAPDKSGVTITRGTPEAIAPVAPRKGTLSLFRKSDKLPTAAGLAESDTRMGVAENALNKERDEVTAGLSMLDDDPEAKQRARQRIADIDAELIAVRQAREDVATALVKASEREEHERQARARADQEKITAKLMRTGASRLNAAAKAYADVLNEFRDDKAAWNRLGSVGNSAYIRLRAGKSAGVMNHPLTRASVWTLDGKCEFGELVR